MADPSTNPPRRDPRTQGSTNRPRPAPVPPKQPTPRPFPAARFTPESIPIVPEPDSLLDQPAEPSDDSPTVISKNQPRPAEPPAGDLRGRRLAHFELIEQIGVGGMAAVLRAHDTQLDRDVALKILPPDMAADPENVRRFHQEARSAARLDHENIARVFFCGEDQGLHFIAFEFVEGDNLRVVLERRGRLSVAEALPILIQVTAGLSHAADRGVVHRDIKPSNIILTPAGRAKLVDMGLARTLERKDEQGLTQSGVTLGTFDYISPEQALEPRDADVRSDIYSLGCTFYHMLTGRPPVPEGTAARKLHHHQHIKPVDPRELVGGLSDPVVAVLARMMAKRAEDRYQNAGQLLQALLACAKQVHVCADTPEGVLFLDAALPQPGRTRPLLLAAMAVAAVVGLVMLLEPTGTSLPPAPDPPRDLRKPADDVRARGPDGADALPQPPDKDRTPAKGGNDNPDTNPQPPERFDADANVPPDRLGQQLGQWLTEHKDAQQIEVVLDGGLDLAVSNGTVPNLVFAARRKVVIRGKDPARPPTVRLKHDGSATKQDVWPAFVVDSPLVEVEGIRFLLDAGEGKVPMVGLRQLGGACTVKRCVFLQVRPVLSATQRGERLASVVVEPARGDAMRPGDPTPPSLTLEGCCFLGFKEMTGDQGKPLQLRDADRGGLDAVVRRGPASITARQCAFGPHADVFRLEGATDNTLPPVVQVEHCTFLTGPTPPSTGADAGHGTSVFHLIGGARAALDVRASLIARAGEGRTTVVRQDGDGEVTFQGQDNRYFGLTAFRANADGVLIGFDQKDMAWPEPLRAAWKDSDDSRSQVLKANPMRDEGPLRRLDEVAYPEQWNERARAAFQVEDRLRELRPTEGPDKHLIGVEKFAAGDYTAVTPPNLDLALRGVRVVDPKRDDAANGFYQTLDEAVAAARSGEKILLRFDGPLPCVSPLTLKLKKNEKAFALEIRAEEGFHPVLTWQVPQSIPEEAVLFSIPANCTLTVDGVAFRLKSPHNNLKVHAVAALLGEGECVFRNCSFTLEPNEPKVETRLCVVVCCEPKGEMMMGKPPPPEARRKVDFDRCFVRGQGDLVWGNVARPCTLKIQNSAVALTGALLDVEVGLQAAPTGEQDVQVQLTRVTAYLGGMSPSGGDMPQGAIRVSAQQARFVLPVRFTPKDCLFVPAKGGNLIAVRMGDTSEETLKERLVWEAAGITNAYGYTTMLTQDTPDGAPRSYDMGGWKREFARDEQSTFRGVQLDEPGPTEPAEFAKLRPEQLKPNARVRDGLGAELKELGRLLPPEVK